MDGDMSQNTVIPDDPKVLVQASYDRIATTYLEWTSAKPTARLEYLGKLLMQLQNASRATVLELGCGAGIPCTKLLAERCGHVIANDISESQIALAQSNVPGAQVHFIRDDMTNLALEASSLQAVVAFYSIIHLPREEQRTMMAQIWTWLSPGGFLVCNLGVRDDPGATREWLGSAKMYWSSFDAETNLQSLRSSGFTIIDSQILPDDEDGRIVPFLWVLARKGLNE
ncbi:putative O-methyltransferase [Cladophialophora carrionii]|uniref:Putative O-methyltransferase n=1 Tax=Cladophialophora carrionii TaxID=86049 RepID=A0A1C1CUB6_9EURO|nr:putative O-methyltransferase [Cladophialophora carrionii]